MEFTKLPTLRETMKALVEKPVSDIYLEQKDQLEELQREYLVLNHMLDHNLQSGSQRQTELDDIHKKMDEKIKLLKSKIKEHETNIFRKNKEN